MSFQLASFSIRSHFHMYASQAIAFLVCSPFDRLIWSFVCTTETTQHVMETCRPIAAHLRCLLESLEQTRVISACAFLKQEFIGCPSLLAHLHFSCPSLPLTENRGTTCEGLGLISRDIRRILSPSSWFLLLDSNVTPQLIRLPPWRQYELIGSETCASPFRAPSTAHKPSASTLPSFDLHLPSSVNSSIHAC